MTGMPLNNGNWWLPGDGKGRDDDLAFPYAATVQGWTSVSVRAKIHDCHHGNQHENMSYTTCVRVFCVCVCMCVCVCVCV